MNTDAYSEISDSTLKSFVFSEEPILVFIDAFERYGQCVEPLKGEGNRTVENEIKLIDKILSQLRQKEKETETEGDATIHLDFINWCLLTDVLYKYCAIKNSEYNEKKGKAVSEFALEGEKIKLDAINRVAQIKLFQNIDAQGQRARKRTIVPNLSLPYKTSDIETRKSNIQEIRYEIQGDYIHGNKQVGDIIHGDKK